MPRWQPDPMLIPALRTGRCGRGYADLSPADRAWSVAGLSQAGLTAEKIATLLKCSLRTIRIVKADPLCLMARTLMTETSVFESETRLLRSELTNTTAELAAAQQEARRLRDRLLRATARDGDPLCPRGLHRMGRYQTYEHQGRRFCRECHRDDQAAYRERRKTVVV